MSDRPLPPPEVARDPLLSAVDLVVRFDPPERPLGPAAPPVQAVRGVTLELLKGECLALVGESGAGKTTLARALLHLLSPTSGTVLFRGRALSTLSRREILDFRRSVQIVFQDPYGSLNPRLRAGNALEEVLSVHSRDLDREARRERVDELLRLVGLSPGHRDRFPHQLSGGQRQRLGIARALAVSPEVLVLDEPVSSLDLSVRAQILGLLSSLRAELELTLLLVAHDLSVVRQLADRVAVLYLGQLVEIGPADSILRHPLHPYTGGLLAAADPDAAAAPGGGDGRLLPGDPPNPADPPPGCPLHPRCPHPARDGECLARAPGLVPIGRGRSVACWKVKQGGERPLTPL